MKKASPRKPPAVLPLPEKEKGKAGRITQSDRKPASTQGERAADKHTTQITMKQEHRITGYQQELAATPIEAVASIAATLTRQGIEPADSVRQAYELLEIAAAGQLSLKASGAWSIGIASVENGKRAFQARMEAQLPNDVSKKDTEGERLRGEDGKWLPVPFDEAMAALMPRLKKGERMPRFKNWIKSAEGLSMIEAGERMAELQREGIPGQVFQSARVTFQTWWESHKRGVKAAAGSMARKGTQGRVKSKTDKRKGERPRKHFSK